MIGTMMALSEARGRGGHCIAEKWAAVRRRRRMGRPIGEEEEWTHGVIYAVAKAEVFMLFIS